MHDNEFKEHLYSKNEDTVRIANKALGMAIGAKHESGYIGGAYVGIRVYVETLARRYLINTSDVIAHANKHYDYLTRPAGQQRRVYNIGALFGWDGYYSDSEIKELDDNLDIVNDCFAFVYEDGGN